MNLMVVEKLAGGISLVQGENLGRYPYSHSLLIEDELTVLIDPASDFQFLSQLAVENRVDVILLSHYHEDHFWYSYLFPQAEIWMPEIDKPALDSLDALLDAYRLSGTWREDWRKLLLEKFHYQPREKSRLLHDRDEISLGRTRMQVLHTPGHTGGSSSFLFPDQGVVFIADIDLTRFGPWYGDLSSDIDDFLRSIQKVKALACDYFVVSHEQPLYRGDIRKEADAYSAVVEAREEKLRSLLSEPRSMEDIINARIIYRKPREPKSFFDFGEWALLSKHLERMMRKGEVIEQSGKYRLAR